MFPDALLEQPFECYITPNLSGLFQTVYLKNNNARAHVQVVVVVPVNQ